MSNIINATTPLLVESSLTPSGTSRILRGSRVSIKDAATGSLIDADSIYLTVTDSADEVQYLLTPDTLPPIETDPGPVYSVDEIDVTGFPSGDISLVWSITDEDGYTYSSSIAVEYGSHPPLVVVADQSATVQDSTFTLDEAKTLWVKVTDSQGNPIDGYDVQWVTYDTDTNSVVERVDASLSAVGSGLYSVTHTFSATDYAAELHRYEGYWRFQRVSGGIWYEISGTRQPIRVYGATTDVQAGSLAYCTPQDVRTLQPGIDSFLSANNTTPGDREILLQSHIGVVSRRIHEQVKNSPARNKRELLRDWCALATALEIVSAAAAFSKQAAIDPFMRNLRKRVNRARAAVWGRHRTIRIGSRS